MTISQRSILRTTFRAHQFGMPQPDGYSICRCGFKADSVDMESAHFTDEVQKHPGWKAG